VAFFVVFLAATLASACSLEAGCSLAAGVTGCGAGAGAGVGVGAFVGAGDSATTLGHGSCATASALETSRRFHQRNPDTAAPTNDTKMIKRFMS
jgi:hypothetical protein